MLKTGKTILQRSARTAISIVVAGTLLLPTVPFADIVPAYADTPNTSADASASNEGTKQEAASTSAGTMDAHPLSTGASSDGTDQAMTDFSLDAQNRVSAIVPLDGSVEQTNLQPQRPKLRSRPFLISISLTELSLKMILPTRPSLKGSRARIPREQSRTLLETML